MGLIPTFAEEEKLWAEGYRLIAGIDEVGRGPIAGPVVAAAVILPRASRPSWVYSLRDSKQLTPLQREHLFECIRRDAVPFGVGVVSQETIDERGISAASKLAMRKAVEGIPTRPDFLLIDYVRLPKVRFPQRSITNGDGLSFSIAAASIVAKVTRDRLMVELDRQFPGYGLAQHKGYGTPQHLDLLQRLGPCPLHRRSFAPVQACISETHRRWRRVLYQDIGEA